MGGVSKMNILDNIFCLWRTWKKHTVWCLRKLNFLQNIGRVLKTLVRRYNQRTREKLWSTEKCKKYLKFGFKTKKSFAMWKRQNYLYGSTAGVLLWVIRDKAWRRVITTQKQGKVRSSIYLMQKCMFCHISPTFKVF